MKSLLSRISKKHAKKFETRDKKQKNYLKTKVKKTGKWIKEHPKTTAIIAAGTLLAAASGGLLGPAAAGAISSTTASVGSGALAAADAASNAYSKAKNSAETAIGTGASAASRMSNSAAGQAVRRAGTATYNAAGTTLRGIGETATVLNNGMQIKSTYDMAMAQMNQPQYQQYQQSIYPSTPQYDPQQMSMYNRAADEQFDLYYNSYQTSTSRIQKQLLLDQMSNYAQTEKNRAIVRALYQTI
jgi:hypothetical protein